MPVALATVSLKHASGLERDSASNSFCFVTSVGNAVSQDQAGVIATGLVNFYTLALPTASSPTINARLSPAIIRGQTVHEVKVYDITGKLDGSPHGSPILLNKFQLTNPGTSTALPSEVAACVTLESATRDNAPVESGLTRPKQRRTGRIYLGPLATSCIQAGQPYPRLDPDFINVITGAIDRLADYTLGSGEATSSHLAVWSRKDAAARAVRYVSVANDVDIQRRRGERPTSRTRVEINPLALAA